MRVAIVTGASSGIGLAISNRLLSLDFRVYGISRNFQEKNIHENFIPIELDLTDKSALKDFFRGFNHSIDLLVNSAGFGDFKQLEDFDFDTIDKMVDINLKAPLFLTNYFLKKLKQNKGYIINISSIESLKHSRFSTIYTATKSGLRAFSLTLFEEARKSGVKVTNINPDITNTDFFKGLNFAPSKDKGSYLIVEQIADAVEYILSDENRVITELTIRPQILKLDKR